MRAVVQRVSYASVAVNKQIVGQIGQGLLILLGIGLGDTDTQVKTVHSLTNCTNQRQVRQRTPNLIEMMKHPSSAKIVCSRIL